MTHTMRFAGLSIEYDARVLEPRAWTELQSRWAAELVVGAPPGRLLELCSGAGHIGLGAASLAGRELTCVDVDPVACAFTRRNADRAGLSKRVEVRESRLEQALAVGEWFVVALADPPWVPTGQVGRFPGDPELAIDGGTDGLALARACVEACTGHLTAGSSLLLQVGDDEQADVLTAYAGRGGWSEAGRRHGPPGRGLVVRLRHPQE